MTRKLTMLFAASAILAGLGTATAVLAEESTPSSQPSQHGTGMMGDHSGMMNMMGQMSPNQMRQMTEMVDNCNRMMGSMTTVPTPNEKAAPDSKG
jgi:hypothetical protein